MRPATGSDYPRRPTIRDFPPDPGTRRTVCESTSMSAPPDVPPIVARAFDVSRRAGYVSFCRNETGRLLAALAATRTGTMAEFGTGCGVGTAWLRSGARQGTQIVSAELDPDLAGAASEVFADDPQVEVVAADWSTLGERGPFALLFLDAREPKVSGPDVVSDLVEPGASSCSTTSPRASPGRRSTRAGSTPSASAGSPTSASPPPR